MQPQPYAELAELAGGFIHEIKNHLGTLGLTLQNLAEDLQDPQSPRERRALERITRLRGECDRLVEVSNDFLRFARAEDLQRQPTYLDEVIDEMLDFFGPTARTHEIEIKSYVPADLPPVSLDRELFKQALLNLLLNAQQAMPKGGELTIQAGYEPPDTPSTPPPGRVRLSLIDTGVGMSPEVLAKAFRPFYSMRQGGSGLGLPTTRKIVEAHGGSISAESEVGRGTRFTLRLPACERAPAPGAVGEAAGNPESSKQRIAP